MSAIPRLVMAGAILLALGLGAREAHTRGLTPLTSGFHWPQVTTHDTLANDLLKQIPPQASVSAQSDLVPHLSERRFVYLFPDHADSADYVFLDVTGNIFPLQNTPGKYVEAIQALVSAGTYHLVAAEDGYLLFAHGGGAGVGPAPGDPNQLPAAFYSFTQAAGPPSHTLAIRFSPSLELVGYDLWPAGNVNYNVTGLRIATYWRVTGPLPTRPLPQLLAFPPGGAAYALTDLPTLEWLPLDRWPAGATMVVATRIITPPSGAGTLSFGARALQTAGSDAGMPLPAAIAAPFESMQPYPRLDRATETVLFAGEQVIP